MINYDRYSVPQTQPILNSIGLEPQDGVNAAEQMAARYVNSLNEQPQPQPQQQVEQPQVQQPQPQQPQVQQPQVQQPVANPNELQLNEPQVQKPAAPAIKREKGHLGYYYTDTPNLQTDTGKFIPASVSFNEDPTTGNVSIDIESQKRFLDSQDVDEKDLSHQQFRKATLIKWFLDRGFGDRDIGVTPEESAAASAEFGTPRNVRYRQKLITAATLVRRITDPDRTTYDTDGIYADRYFANANSNITPSDYMAKGEGALIPGIARGDEVAELAARQQEKAEELKTLLESKPKIGDFETVNPFATELQKKSQELAIAKEDFAATAPSAKATIKKKQQQIAILEGEVQVLGNRSSAWSAQITARDSQRKAWQASWDLFQKKWSEEDALKRQEMRMARGTKTGVAGKRWVGTGEGDTRRFAGFMATGLRQIPISSRNTVIIDPVTKKPHTVQLSPTAWRKKMSIDNPEAFLAMTEEMPTEDQLFADRDSAGQQGALRQTETMYNSAYHLRELSRLNSLLKQGGLFNIALQGEDAIMKITNPELREAAIHRMKLIGDMRNKLIGPGNPSNYEQEIMASLVPEVEAIFSSATFNQKRLRALAMIQLIGHAQAMRTRGLELTDETIDIYNSEFGSIIGKKITKATFSRLMELSSEKASYYASRKQANANDKIDGKGYLDWMENMLGN